MKVAGKPARRVRKKKEAVASSMMGALLRDEKPAGKDAQKTKEARAISIGTQLGDFIVRETASVLGNPEPPSADVIIIRAGPGNPADAHYYTDACLEDSVQRGIWNGVPCHLDHPTDSEDKDIPERSVESMAGYFGNAKMVTVTDEATHQRVKAVSATFTPEHGHEMVLRKLRTAAQYSQEYPNRSYVGFSINAKGMGESATIDSKQYDRVDKITGVESVDIVTRAGAGGKLLTFRESYRMAKAAVKDKTTEAADKAKTVPFTEAHAKAMTEALTKAGVSVSEAQITEAFGQAAAPAAGSNGNNGSAAPAADDDDDDSALKTPDQKTYESKKADPMDDDSKGPDAEDAKEAAADAKEAAAKSAADAKEVKKGGNKPPWLEDDAQESDDGDIAESTISMSVEAMTRGQLKQFAKEALSREAAATREAAAAKIEANAAKREAADAVREVASMKESARAAVADLKTQLREGEATKIVENLGIPTSHRPRVLREMHRDGGKTRAGMLAIAEEYVSVVLPTLGGGGAIIRESGVPQKLVIDCFAD
ncbi:MAG: hypothetical protein NVSMB19_25340 [Vulcanimicrobiaceae bacterium]